MEYSEMHMSYDVAHKYDVRFNWPPLRVQADLERQIIAKVLRRFKPLRVYDLACGTGRILRIVEDESTPNTTQLCGFDNSPQMLNLAKMRARSAELVKLDLRSPDYPRFEKADLITCFRFYANADSSIRKSANKFVLSNLKTGGLFLVNNHKNSQSLTAMILRARGYDVSKLSSEEALFTRTFLENFDLVEKWSIGILPNNEERYFLNSKLSSLLDRNLGKISKNKGMNNILLLRLK